MTIKQIIQTYLRDWDIQEVGDKMLILRKCNSVHYIDVNMAEYLNKHNELQTYLNTLTK